MRLSYSFIVQSIFHRPHQPQQPRDAAGFCAYNTCCDSIIEDCRVPVSLLHHFAMQYLSEPRQLISLKYLKNFQRHQRVLMRKKWQHDYALRLLFAWCASTLLADLRIAELEVSGAASNQYWDCHSFRRAISTLLFHRFWEFSPIESCQPQR